MKIVNGKYAPIPTVYSKDLRNLVTILLNKDPSKRPRVHDILNFPIMKNRIKEFLTKSQVGIEFNHTIIHKKDLNQIYIENKQREVEEKLEEKKENQQKWIEIDLKKKDILKSCIPNKLQVDKIIKPEPLISNYTPNIMVQNQNKIKCEPTVNN